LAEQAYAYVTLIPVAKGFQQKAAQELSGLGGVGNGLGDKAAKGFSDSFGSSIKRLIGPAAFIGIGVAFGNFVSSAVKGASNLQAEFEGVNQVFGTSAKAIQDFAKKASASAGLTEVEALRASKTMGLFASSAGLSATGAAKFSTDLVQLAGDLGSFNDVPTPQALAAIQSGLQGQAEPLRQFGVFLTEDALKAEAMAMGLHSGSGALDAQTKMLASYNVIMKSTTLQQGDFVKYASDFGNAQKTMSANFENMKNSLATNLLPVLGQLMAAMSPLIEKLGPMLFNVFQKLIPLFELVTDTVAKLLPIMDPIIEAFGMLVEIVVEMIRIALPPFLEIFNALIPILKPIMTLFMTLVRTILPPLAKIFSQVLVPILEFVVDLLVRYFIPVWSKLAELFGGVLSFAVDVIVNGFKLLKIALTPIWNLLKPLIEGLMNLAGIKPITISATVTTEQSSLISGGGKVKGVATDTLGAIDLSGLASGSIGSASTKADLKKARKDMIAAFRKDVLKNIGPEIVKDPESLTNFMTKVSDFISSALTDKTITKKTAKAAQALVKSYTAQLAPIVKAHTEVIKQLEKAQDDLTKKIQARTEYIAKITEQFGNKLAIDEKTTAQTAIDQLKERIANTKALLGFMTQLRTMGLSGDLYQQILESGNLGLAKSIVEGGSAAVTELNTLAAEANTVAMKLGQDAAMILHDKGIEVAQGVVDGLIQKQGELSAQMASLATAFGNALDLVITGSVSKAVQSVQGMFAGIQAAMGASVTGLGTDVMTVTESKLSTAATVKAVTNAYNAKVKALDAKKGVTAKEAAADAAKYFGGTLSQITSAIKGSPTTTFKGDLASVYDKAKVPTATTIIYNAAENQSLDSAAALQTAIDRVGLIL
jgi:phage-related protein